MPTNVEIYQNSNPVPVKILMPDGMVLAFDGSVVLPANAARAIIYANSNFVPSKWLMPDGSIVSGMPATLDADQVIVNASVFVKNLGPTDTDVQTALETIDQMAAGVSNEVEVLFSWGDATPEIIVSMAAGKIVNLASIIIVTPFNDIGATLSLGVLGSPELFMKKTECDPSNQGVYTTSPAYKFLATDTILLFITPGSASMGDGKVVINF